jgi:hypothetical protein
MLAAITRPSPGPSGSLALYRRMYRLRLAREVAREYPATRALLGAERFGRLARAFVDAHPSRSFTLDGYAAALPRFLRRRCPAAAELARLERALSDVRRAERRRAPAAAGALRLAPAAGARLHGFSHDVERGYARWRAGHPPGPLRRRASWLALHRRGAEAVPLRVRRVELPLLRALLRGERLERALPRCGLGEAALRSALARWVGAGLLSPPPTAPASRPRR